MATKKPENRLIGMKEITEYTGRTRRVVLKWIADAGFPAVLMDGRWESDADLIDGWRTRRIEAMTRPECGGLNV